jgi:cytochrome oxidase Cu insertion factor (SCO1/SenC/PrrC family)
MRRFGDDVVSPRARTARRASAALFGFAAAYLASVCAAAGAPPPAPNPFTQPSAQVVATGDLIPSGTFVDQTGAAKTFDDFRGSTVVAGFVYTSCKDECPLITRKFGELERLLPPGQFHLVEISIDPAHDTPRVLAAYARRYDVHVSRRSLLTGSPDAIGRFERSLGVSAIDDGRGTILHNDRTIIVDPSGRIADIIDEAGWTPDDVAADAKTAAGVAANPLDRIDLALGRTVAYVCGGVVSGRAGLADLLAVVAIFGLSAWAMVWVSRKIFSGVS